MLISGRTSMKTMKQVKLTDENCQWWHEHGSRLWPWRGGRYRNGNHPLWMQLWKCQSKCFHTLTGDSSQSLDFNSHCLIDKDWSTDLSIKFFNSILFIIYLFIYMRNNNSCLNNTFSRLGSENGLAWNNMLYLLSQSHLRRHCSVKVCKMATAWKPRQYLSQAGTLLCTNPVLDVRFCIQFCICKVP